MARTQIWSNITELQAYMRTFFGGSAEVVGNFGIDVRGKTNNPAVDITSLIQRCHTAPNLRVTLRSSNFNEKAFSTLVDVRGKTKWGDYFSTVVEKVAVWPERPAEGFPAHVVVSVKPEHGESWMLQGAYDIGAPASVR